MVNLTVFSDSMHREDLRAIAEDIIETEENTGSLTAGVYDSDSAVYDPGVRGHAKLRNPRGRLEMGGIFINFSMENWEPKKGYYKVVEYCVSPQVCDYTYPIE